MDNEKNEKVMIQEVATHTYLVDTHYTRPGVGAMYLLFHAASKKFLIVDCGTAHAVETVQELVRKLGSSLQNLETIVLTHVHLDHGSGAGMFLKHAPNAKLYVHPKGQRHIINPSKLLQGAKSFYEVPIEKLFGTVLPCPAEQVISAEDNQVLDFYGRKLQIHFSPGHAKHHMSLWDVENKIYFAGDSAAMVYPNWSTPEKFFALIPSSPIDFDPILWQQTVKEIRAKKPKKILLTHFGEVNNTQKLLVQIENGLQKLIFIAFQNKTAASGKERIQKIAADINMMITEELLAINSSWGVETIKDWFQKDCYIAAFGLDHWLSR